MLYCNDCEQTIQTISANKTIVEEEWHNWLWAGDGASGGNNKVGAIYDFYCYNCGETITLEPPCSHESLVNSDSEGLHCSVCGKDFGPDVIDGPVNECKHTSYTIIYPGTEETWYDQWNADLHLKKTMVSYYVDDDTTWGYDATCNDCGADLIYENGKIDDTIYSGRSGVDYKSIKSVFEAHSFVDGVCEHCGEKQTDESCQHTETKRVENTGKRTTELKSLNETEHEVTTTKYYELHCAACDAYISDDGTDTTTEKQPHDFSNGNTCACGYTKAEESCQHTKTKRVESVGSRKTELISLNDAEHEVKTTKTFKIRCAACDAYIRDDGTETTTVNKPHDLGNGNTCTCGYTKVETPEDAPYVLGFTMSVTEIEVDGTVTFTLSIATAKDGDKLAIEMRADDKFTVDKKVTVKDGKASCAHKFRNTGDRSIKFRVAGGEYCAAQTLKVLPKKTGTSAITGVRVSPPINEARVEKKDGETFTVTVVCNLDTVCVEMYFGKEHNQDTYRSSKDKEYVEANGTRTFTLTYTLGGNGKRYAGDYPIVVSPFSYVDADWTKNQMGTTVNAGTLKVTHDMNEDEQCMACGYLKCTRAAASMALSYMGIDLLPKDLNKEGTVYHGYAKDAERQDPSCNTRGGSTNSTGSQYPMTYDRFLEMYNDYASDNGDKYSPVVIHTQYRKGSHAFIVVGHDQTDPEYFYVVDSGHRERFGRVKLTQEGQLKVAEYQILDGNNWVTLIDNKYSTEYNLMGVWQYYRK